MIAITTLLGVSALPLLEARIRLVNDVDAAFAPHDAAAGLFSFYRSFDFHAFTSLLTYLKR
jgi:hypothetical protein